MNRMLIQPYYYQHHIILYHCHTISFQYHYPYHISYHTISYHTTPYQHHIIHVPYHNDGIQCIYNISHHTISTSCHTILISYHIDIIPHHTILILYMLLVVCTITCPYHITPHYINTISYQCHYPCQTMS